MKKAIHLVLVLSGLFAGAVSAATWNPTTFEFDCWQRLLPPERAENAVVSPAGLAVALGMLGEGTSGTPRADIAQTVGVLTDFGATFQALLASYEEVNASNIVALTIADALWMRDLRGVSVDYLHSIQRNFGAEIGFLAPEPVDAWTEARTDGRIRGMATNIGRSAKSLLVNAVAFQGTWARPFAVSNTAGRAFHRADGSAVELPMMNDTRRVRMIRRPGYAIIRLDYYCRRLSFWILLPDAGKTLGDVRHDFGADACEAAARAFNATADDAVTNLVAAVALPAFRVTTTYNLLPALRAFKVPVAGYPRISPDFTMEGAVHTAWLAVDEVGTAHPGAAQPRTAAKNKDEERTDTVRHMTRAGDTSDDDDDDDQTARRPVFQEDPPSGWSGTAAPLVCDRPFLFLVRDDRTDTTLIAGQFTGR